jgi:hypothetical protein
MTSSELLLQRLVGSARRFFVSKATIGCSVWGCPDTATQLSIADMRSKREILSRCADASIREVGPSNLVPLELWDTNTVLLLRNRSALVAWRLLILPVVPRSKRR